MELNLPSLSLVVLIGPSGSGKSTFAKRHFQSTEILSSDAFRAMVSDDENDQECSAAAFDVLRLVLHKRLGAGRLTVVDATNVQPSARKELVAIAREHHVLPVAIVFDLELGVCVGRNDARSGRPGSARHVRRQLSDLRRSIGRGDARLRREGFRETWRLAEPAAVDSVEIRRIPMWTDRRDLSGPFDVVGDVHGCLEELEELLDRLGYEGSRRGRRHPEGRMAVFLGDLVDRGPSSLGVLSLVREMVDSGSALCLPGNHDVKFLRALNGSKVQRTHGLEKTMSEFEALDEEDRESFRSWAVPFLDGLVSHFVLDKGDLVVAHAGMKEEMQGRGSGAVRQFALYGETTGETDEYGLPVRADWASAYQGKACVVHGHTPVPEAEWNNRVICIDTGCVFGGKLTALRWPERELVSVSARRIWCEPVRPLVVAPAAADGLLDLGDPSGVRHIRTQLQSTIRIPADRIMAAIESASRFGADPRWVIHLPPTMSPVAASNLDGYLEHPAEAFAYFRDEGVAEVVCQRKHMGSRCIAVVCRSEDVARKRFGASGGSGLFYTRTGRRFFDDPELERVLLADLRDALGDAGFWREFGSDWFCIDGEMMPWSAKAQDQLRRQYASTGAVGSVATSTLTRWLEEGAARGLELGAMLAASKIREASMKGFVDAWRRYSWPVEGPSGYRWAPFHILACEGRAFDDSEHVWQMETLGRLCAHSRHLLLPTKWKRVDLSDPTSEAQATEWWMDLTGSGGEGMVVKPPTMVARGTHGLVQPAVKCRGREYLRLIYGPEYLEPANLERLRRRSLRHKRVLAGLEFALGMESLRRFVANEPLSSVHEAVLGVLALESEPVDPRL